MASSVVDGDLRVRGAVTANSINYPAGSVLNSSIVASAGISASKIVRHESINAELFAEGAAITALASKLLHIATASGVLMAFEAIITTQATGGDRTVTVDLQKSTAGGAFATVLTTTVNITNGTAIRTPVAATILTTAFVDGDIFRAVVTVAGAAGAQAAGLLITLTLEENHT